MSGKNEALLAHHPAVLGADARAEPEVLPGGLAGPQGAPLEADPRLAAGAVAAEGVEAEAVQLTQARG